VTKHPSAKCPRCGHKSTTPYAGNQHTWYCHGCGMAFETVEDGTTPYGDPSRIAARRENHRRTHRIVRVDQ
jgi:ribosomal protein L37AE/L43A